MKNFSIFVVCAYFLCSAYAEVVFEDCGSKIGNFSLVSVSGCDLTKTACVLHRNTNATISIEFTVDEPVTEIKTIVHGIIMGMEVPFQLPQPNGCLDSGVTCPLSSGHTYKYSATLPVLKVYPKVRVSVKWELKSADLEDIVCVIIPAELK